MGGVSILVFITIIVTFIIIKKLYDNKHRKDNINKNETNINNEYKEENEKWKEYYEKLQEKSIKRIGEQGEEEVAKVLGETIEGIQYVINDIIVQTKNNQTSQIDHIFINENGIWVIETKYRSGHIYGKEYEHQWTQFNNYGEQKTFYNPIKQNARHIYNLKDKIGKNIYIKSLVVFINANLERVEAENVINIEDLWETLWTEEEVKITKEEMKKWYTKIKEATKNNITEEEHIQGIKTKQENLEKRICPRCGGKLILRKGEYGEFYGCSKYPNCKFTKNKY